MYIIQAYIKSPPNVPYLLCTYGHKRSYLNTYLFLFVILFDVEPVSYLYFSTLPKVIQQKSLWDKYYYDEIDSLNTRNKYKYHSRPSTS